MRLLTYCHTMARYTPLLLLRSALRIYLTLILTRYSYANKSLSFENSSFSKHCFFSQQQGDRGPEGPRGRDGAQGNEGMEGPPGPQGEPGDSTATRLKGQKGEPGKFGFDVSLLIIFIQNINAFSLKI